MIGEIYEIGNSEIPFIPTYYRSIAFISEKFLRFSKIKKIKVKK